MSLKLLLVAGARPNFMKVAPLIHAIERHNAALPLRLDRGEGTGEVSNSSASSDLRSPTSGSALRTSHSALSYRLVHTGQHYDAAMSDVFFQELGIPAPDFNLDVGSGSHAAQTAEIMRRFEPVLLNAFSDSPLRLDRGEGQGEVSNSSPFSALRAPDSALAGGTGDSPVTAGDPPGASTSRSALRTPPSALSSGAAAPISDLRSPTSDLGPRSDSAFRTPHSALPDWVVVVGDVNSTVACTLVAVKLGIRVAHVEAGLRSFDRAMPEEINRLVTDSIADLLLTPSEDGNENLRREGIPDSKIRLVGNIMIDSLVANLDKAQQSRALDKFSVRPGSYVYVTLHRPANVDDRASLTAIADELKKLSHQFPVVFPVHPRTRKMFGEFGIELSQHNGFRLAEPVGYHDSVCLTKNARLVLTDSGGLQEEATFFQTPCLTLRPNTERPVTVTMGSNRLTNVARLSEDLNAMMSSAPRLGRVPPLWDGKTAERIIAALLSADR